jgi:hypothetical protein
MPDTKITGLLSPQVTTNPATDVLPIVNIADTLMASSGSTRKITVNQLLGAGGTATLASATISGDLTVDTSTLKVDSTNNRVGIVNASPSFPLDLTGTGSNTPFRLLSGSGTNIRYDSTRNVGGVNRNWIIGCDETAEGSFALIPSTAIGGATFTNPVYRVTAAGVHTFFDGAGGTYATLNSTGLGVGTVPANGLKLSSYVTTAGVPATSGTTQSAGSLRIGAASTAGVMDMGTNGSYSWIQPCNATNLATNYDLVLNPNGGNVGIGVTPSAKLDVVVPGAGSPRVRLDGTSDNPFIEFQRFQGTASNFFGSRVQGMFGGMAFWVSNSAAIGSQTFTQAMTLDASGNLLVGQTNAALDAQGGFWLRNAAASGGSSIIVNHRTAVSSGNSYAEFTYNGVGIGSITQNGTTGVLYNINSDYRLKESVALLSGGLARVNALKPSIYKWKSDGSSGEGFLAHELAEVVPFAVTGEKDAVNEDGSIKSQGIDMSRVVPILVAAIQELTARVQTLEAK